MAVIGRVAGKPKIGRSLDSPPLRARNRSICRLIAGPLFHFHKCESSALHGDEINLTRGSFFPPRQDAMPFRHEQCRRQPLGAMPAKIARPPLGDPISLRVLAHVASTRVPDHKRAPSQLRAAQKQPSSHPARSSQ